MSHFGALKPVDEFISKLKLIEKNSKNENFQEINDIYDMINKDFIILIGNQINNNDQI